MALKRFIDLVRELVKSTWMKITAFEIVWQVHKSNHVKRTEATRQLQTKSKVSDVFFSLLKLCVCVFSSSWNSLENNEQSNEARPRLNNCQIFILFPWNHSIFCISAGFRTEIALKVKNRNIAVIKLGIKIKTGHGLFVMISVNRC